MDQVFSAKRLAEIHRAAGIFTSAETDEIVERPYLVALAVLDGQYE